MILRSIDLESFGRFRNRSFDFRRGMNLVIGPNEAGKSTLAEAVPAVLFGTDHLERFKTWGRNSCSAALFFEGGGRTIKIKRDLLTDEVTLVEKDDLYHVLSEFSGKVPLRGRSAICREYRDLIAALLGVGDETLFRATYLFGHQPQEWTGEDLARQLRILVGGSAENDYAQIIDELLEEHFELTRSNPWGRDKQRDRVYEELCQQLELAGGEDRVPVFVELDSDDDLAGQIAGLTAELVHDRLEYEKGRQYINRVRAQAIPDTEPAASAQGIGDAQSATTLEGLQQEFKAAGLPENPPPELPEVLEDAAEVRQQLAELQQPYAILSNREKKVPSVPWAALAVVLVLFAITSGLAWWQSFAPIRTTAVAAAIVLLTACWCGWRQLARTKSLAICRKERNLLDQKKHSAQQRQAELSDRCEALGLPSSPIDLVRLQKLVAAHRQLLEIYWQQLAEPDRQAAPVAESVSQPPDETQAAGDEGAEVAAEVQELEHRMAAFAAQLEAKEKHLEELRAQQAANDSATIGEATTNPAHFWKRKHEIEGRIVLLRKAIDLLAGAVDEFSRTSLVRLSEEASRLLTKVTAGKYRALRLDENMLPAIQIDSRRWQPATQFSRGTVDAIYLALRIALAKVRDDGRSLPLMLDDPFVHLDEKRLAKALNMVDLASAGGQLLLFSHNLELGKRAARERWNVIALDGDSATTQADEEGETHAGQLHLL